MILVQGKERGSHVGSKRLCSERQSWHDLGSCHDETVLAEIVSFRKPKPAQTHSAIQPLFCGYTPQNPGFVRFFQITFQRCILISGFLRKLCAGKTEALTRRQKTLAHVSLFTQHLVQPVFQWWHTPPACRYFLSDSEHPD